jgi:hypothetical protein
MTRALYLAACLAVAGAAACSSSSTGQAVPNAAGGVRPYAARPAFIDVNKGALAALDAMSFQFKVVLDEVRSDTPPDTGSTDGTCKNGIEVFVPDRKGEANSQEYLYFYDAACKSLSRSIVRTYGELAPSKGWVMLNISSYRAGDAKPNSIRLTWDLYTHASFDKSGYPIVSRGFVREAHVLVSTGAKSKLYEHYAEFILGPSTNDGATLCGQSAGYDAVRLRDFIQVFGASGALDGQSSTDAKTGVTSYSAYFGADAYQADDFRVIKSGTYNDDCPMGSQPTYHLSSGTSLGSSSGAFAMTFSNGTMTNLSASSLFAESINLTIVTNTKTFPTDPDYVHGTLAYAGRTVATFDVNEFGNGTYNVTRTGLKYTVLDWIPLSTRSSPH